MAGVRSVVRAALLAAAACLGAMAPAVGQDVNGVQNASITPGYSSISFRVGHSYFDDQRPSTSGGLAQYQRSIGDKWSTSYALLVGRRGDEAIKVNALQAIVQRQLLFRKTDGFDLSAIAIARTPNFHGGPGRAAGVIATKWVIAEDNEIRAVLGAAHEYGEDARKGFNLAFRTEATRRLGLIGRAGVQTSSTLSTSAPLGRLREQSHQAGLVFKTPVRNAVQLSVIGLGGLTEAAPAAEAKVFLTIEL